MTTPPQDTEQHTVTVDTAKGTADCDCGMGAAIDPPDVQWLQRWAHWHETEYDDNDR